MTLFPGLSLVRPSPKMLTNTALVWLEAYAANLRNPEVDEAIADMRE